VSGANAASANVFRAAMGMASPLRRLLTFVLYLMVPFFAVPSDADDRLPIFDVHMHYNQGAWSGLTPKQIVEWMDLAGVSRALVSSTPDEGTLALHRYDPGRFIAELRPYGRTVNSVNWYRHPEVVPFLESRLINGIYRGIGEIHFYAGKEVNTAVVRAVVAQARSLGIFLHVHSDAEAIAALYAIDPEVRILWAHAGMTEPADVVAETMKRYPTLSAELSYRAEEILPDGELDPEWRDLLVTFSHRFVIGTDTHVNARWVEYEDLVDAHRAWLSLLPQDHARAIAFENAERMFRID